jgi:alpha-tubulin suppressor-like RCC1 family protein
MGRVRQVLFAAMMTVCIVSACGGRSDIASTLSSTIAIPPAAGNGAVLVWDNPSQTGGSTFHIGASSGSGGVGSESSGLPNAGAGSTGGRAPIQPDAGVGAALGSGGAVPEDAGVDAAVDVQVPHAILLYATTFLLDCVSLSWLADGSGMFTDYELLRDGAFVANVSPEAESYDDCTTEAGTASAPSSLTATQGTRTDSVGLTWATATPISGAEHFYQLRGTGGSSQPIASNLAWGARAAPMIRDYEFSRDDGETWQAAGSTSTWDDFDAALSVLKAPVQATPRYPLGYVRLEVTAEPTVLPPAESIYRVRARTSLGVSPPSDSALGFRGVGNDIEYQWQRSSADSDANYTDLPGVTGAIWFDDTATSDKLRHYRAVMRSASATGVTDGTPAKVVGYKSVSAGYSHGCGITSDDKVICWGASGMGQIPTGPTADSYSSIVADGFNDDTCGIRADDGAIVCWGNWMIGTPRVTPPSGSFKSLSLGNSGGGTYLCAVRSDDTVYCPAYDFSDPIKRVSLGNNYACAIREDDTVICAGSNTRGQAPPEPSPDQFRSVHTGQYFTCGLHPDSTVRCWGTDDQRNPIASPEGSFESISVGNWFACGIRPDKTVDCWGSSTFTSGPGQAPFGTDQFSSVSVGNAFVCGLRSDAKVICWGNNYSHQSQARPSTDKFDSISLTDPLSMNGGTICGVRADDSIACWANTFEVPNNIATQSFQSVATGSGPYACAIRIDGKLLCWGSTGEAKAPAGPSTDSYLQVSGGALDTCALRSDGQVECWGENASGILAPPSGTFNTMCLGFNYGCAIRADESLVCWGASGTAAATAPAGSYKQVSCGMWQACAIAPDDQITCWGSTSAGTPPRGTFKSVSVMDSDTSLVGVACGIRTDDRVVCWGDLVSENIAAGPSLDRFLSLNSAKCGIRSDQRVLCWGRGGL